MDWLHPPRTRNDRVISQDRSHGKSPCPTPTLCPFSLLLPRNQIPEYIEKYTTRSFKFNLTIDYRSKIDVCGSHVVIRLYSKVYTVARYSICANRLPSCANFVTETCCPLPSKGNRSISMQQYNDILVGETLTNREGNKIFCTFIYRFYQINFTKFLNNIYNILFFLFFFFFTNLAKSIKSRTNERGDRKPVLTARKTSSSQRGGVQSLSIFTWCASQLSTIPTGNRLHRNCRQSTGLASGTLR